MERMSSLERKDGSPPVSSNMGATASTASEDGLASSQSLPPVPGVALAPTASETALPPTNCPNCTLLNRHLRVSREWTNFFREKLVEKDKLLHIAADYMRQKQRCLQLQLSMDQQSRECGEMREQLTNLLLEVKPLRERLQLAEQRAEDEMKRREKIESKECNLRFILEQQTHKIQSMEKKFNWSLVEVLEKKLNNRRLDIKRMKVEDARRAHVEWELKDSVSLARGLELRALKKAFWGLTLAHKYGSHLLSQGKLAEDNSSQEWSNLQSLLKQVEHNLHQQYLAHCRRVPVRPLKEVWINDFHEEDQRESDDWDDDSEAKKLERLIQNECGKMLSKGEIKQEDIMKSKEIMKIETEPKLKETQEGHASKEAASVGNKHELENNVASSSAQDVVTRSILDTTTEDSDNDSLCPLQNNVKEAASCTLDTETRKKTQDPIQSVSKKKTQDVIQSRSILDTSTEDSNNDPLSSLQNDANKAASYTGNTGIKIKTQDPIQSISKKKTQDVLQSRSILDTSTEDSDNDPLSSFHNGVDRTASCTANTRIKMKTQEPLRLTSILDTSTEDSNNDPLASLQNDKEEIALCTENTGIKKKTQEMIKSTSILDNNTEDCDGQLPRSLTSIAAHSIHNDMKATEELPASTTTLDTSITAGYSDSQANKDKKISPLTSYQLDEELKAILQKMRPHEKLEDMDTSFCNKPNPLVETAMDGPDLKQDFLGSLSDSEEEEEKKVIPKQGAQKKGEAGTDLLPRILTTQISEGFSVDRCHQGSSLLDDLDISTDTIGQEVEEEKEEKDLHKRVPLTHFQSSQSFSFDVEECQSLPTSQTPVLISEGEVSKEQHEQHTHCQSQLPQSLGEHDNSTHDHLTDTSRVQNKVLLKEMRHLFGAVDNTSTLDREETETAHHQALVNTVENNVMGMLERTNHPELCQAGQASTKIQLAEDMPIKGGISVKVSQENDVVNNAKNVTVQEEMSKKEKERYKEIKEENYVVNDAKNITVKKEMSKEEKERATEIEEENNVAVLECKAAETTKKIIVAPDEEGTITAENKTTEDMEATPAEKEEQTTGNVEGRSMGTQEEGTTETIKHRTPIAVDKGTITAKKERITLVEKERIIEAQQNLLSKADKERNTDINDMRNTSKSKEERTRNKKTKHTGVEEERNSQPEQERTTPAEKERNYGTNEERITEVQHKRITEAEKERIIKTVKEKCIAVVEKRSAEIKEGRTRQIKEEVVTENGNKTIIETDQETTLRGEDVNTTEVEEERTQEVEQETKASKREERKASPRKRRMSKRILKRVKQEINQEEEDEEMESSCQARMLRRQSKKYELEEEIQKKNEPKSTQKQPRIKTKELQKIDEGQRMEEQNGHSIHDEELRRKKEREKENKQEEEARREEEHMKKRKHEEEEDRRKEEKGKNGEREQEKEENKIIKNKRVKRLSEIEKMNEEEEDLEKRKEARKKNIQEIEEKRKENEKREPEEIIIESEKKKNIQEEKEKLKENKKVEQEENMIEPKGKITRKCKKEQERRLQEKEAETLREEEEKKKMKEEDERKKRKQEEEKRKIQEEEEKTHEQKRIKQEKADDQSKLELRQMKKMDRETEIKQQQQEERNLSNLNKSNIKENINIKKNIKASQRNTTGQPHFINTGKRQDKILFSWGQMKKQQHKKSIKFYKQSRFNKVLPDPLGCLHHSVFAMECRQIQGSVQEEVNRKSTKEGQSRGDISSGKSDMPISCHQNGVNREETNVEKTKHLAIKEIPARKIKRSLREQNGKENSRHLMKEETFRSEKGVAMESRRKMSRRRMDSSSSNSSIINRNRSSSNNSRNSNRSRSSISNRSRSNGSNGNRSSSNRSRTSSSNINKNRSNRSSSNNSRSSNSNRSSSNNSRSSSSNSNRNRNRSNRSSSNNSNRNRSNRSRTNSSNTNRNRTNRNRSRSNGSNRNRSSSNNSFSDEGDTFCTLSGKMNNKDRSSQQSFGLQKNATLRSCNKKSNHRRLLAKPDKTRNSKAHLFGTDSNDSSDSSEGEEEQDQVNKSRKGKKGKQQQLARPILRKNKNLTSLKSANKSDGKKNHIKHLQLKKTRSLSSSYSSHPSCQKIHESEELMNKRRSRHSSAKGLECATSDSDTPHQPTNKKCRPSVIESESRDSQDDTSPVRYPRKNTRTKKMNGGTCIQENGSSNDNRNSVTKQRRRLSSSCLTSDLRNTCRVTRNEKQIERDEKLSIRRHFTPSTASPTIAPYAVKRKSSELLNVKQEKLISEPEERGHQEVVPGKSRKMSSLSSKQQSQIKSPILKEYKRSHSTPALPTSLQNVWKKEKSVSCNEQLQLRKNIKIEQGNNTREETKITPSFARDRKHVILLKSPPHPSKKWRGNSLSSGLASRQDKKPKLKDSSKVSDNTGEADKVNGNNDTQIDHDAHLRPQASNDQDLIDALVLPNSDDSEEEMVLEEDYSKCTYSTMEAEKERTKETVKEKCNAVVEKRRTEIKEGTITQNEEQLVTENGNKRTMETDQETTQRGEDDKTNVYTPQIQTDATSKSQASQVVRSSRLGPVALVNHARFQKKSVPTLKPAMSVPAGPEYIEKLFSSLNQRTERSSVVLTQDSHTTQPQGTSNSQTGRSNSLSQPYLNQPSRRIDFQGQSPVLLPNMYGSLGPAAAIEKIKPSPSIASSHSTPDHKTTHPALPSSCDASFSMEQTQPRPTSDHQHPLPQELHTTHDPPYMTSGTSHPTPVQPQPSSSQLPECPDESSVSELNVQQMPWLPEVNPERVKYRGKLAKTIAIEDLEETLEEMVAGQRHSKYWAEGLSQICASINTKTLPYFLRLVFKSILRSDPMARRKKRDGLTPKLYWLLQLVCVVERRLAPHHPHSLRRALLRAIQVVITKPNINIGSHSLASLTAWYISSASIDGQAKTGQMWRRARTFLVDLLFYHPGSIHLALLTAAYTSRNFFSTFMKDKVSSGLEQVILWVAHYGQWTGQPTVRSDLTNWLAKTLKLKKKAPKGPIVVANNLFSLLAPEKDKDTQWGAAVGLVVLVRWKGRAWARYRMLPSLLSTVDKITTNVFQEEKSNSRNSKLHEDLKIRISHLFGNLGRALPCTEKEQDGGDDVVKTMEKAVTSLLCSSPAAACDFPSL